MKNRTWCKKHLRWHSDHANAHCLLGKAIEAGAVKGGVKCMTEERLKLAPGACPLVARRG